MLIDEQSATTLVLDFSASLLIPGNNECFLSREPVLW